MGGRSKKRGGKKGGNGGEEGPEVEEPSNKLPMANVVRLMRRVLPQNVKIAGSAKQLTHDCAVDFVGYVGGEAAEQARSEHRRTIAPEHFTLSFESIGFDSYVDPMQTYIQGYREYYDDRPAPRGGRSSALLRSAPAPVDTLSPSAPVDTLSPGAPVTMTDEEMEFLRSVIPPPPGGY